MTCARNDGFYISWFQPAKKSMVQFYQMLALTIGRKSVLDRRGKLPDYDDNPKKSLLGDALPVNKWVCS